MVTRRTLEKYMGQSIEIAGETRLTPEQVEEVLKAVQNRIENNKRNPKPPPPEGGISISKASRKYRIPRTTINEWVKDGHINIILPTSKEKYIDERLLSLIAARYDRLKGRGNRQIKEIIRDLTNK